MGCGTVGACYIILNGSHLAHHYSKIRIYKKKPKKNSGNGKHFILDMYNTKHAHSKWLNLRLPILSYHNLSKLFLSILVTLCQNISKLKARLLKVRNMTNIVHT